MKPLVVILILGVSFSISAYAQVGDKSEVAIRYVEMFASDPQLRAFNYDHMYGWSFYVVVEGIFHPNIYKVAVDESGSAILLDSARELDADFVGLIELSDYSISVKSNAAIMFDMSRLFRSIVPRVHPQQVCATSLKFSRYESHVEGTFAVHSREGFVHSTDHPTVEYNVEFKVDNDGMVHYKFVAP